ncbi:hypothetical protein C474_15934 [Halogeometricum pallidum JCM 14848]|uniref:Uncharacterized protein n=1 Tax=Halogeometricum pallidum JCM 14848 TaxID=1227487 RepID=M0CXS0_HALPD|nr:hypothetical protein [Halogeometricum pallidum]ELZ28006.1 hypothetical protein C474_15934 [Halogeometricum pallidum JCM 14848]
MANDTDDGAWQRTTDHDRIRSLAAEGGAAPARASGPSDELVLSTDGDAESVEWERFFERFDAEDRLLQYRRSGPDDEPVLRVVDRDYVADAEEAAKRERPSNEDEDTVATGDTGDSEPVAYDGPGQDDADDAGRQS